MVAKRKFEQFAKSHGVTIQGYRADNMPFNSTAFQTEMEANNQTIELFGVGAHHQNGVAERAIQTITQWARAMMLHQLLHGPPIAPT